MRRPSHRGGKRFMNEERFMDAPLVKLTGWGRGPSHTQHMLAHWFSVRVRGEGDTKETEQMREQSSALDTLVTQSIPQFNTGGHSVQVLSWSWEFIAQNFSYQCISCVPVYIFNQQALASATRPTSPSSRRKFSFCLCADLFLYHWTYWHSCT